MRPNFLIVGTTKSGTTSLYNYLNQHHNIYLSTKRKESNFMIGDQSELGAGPRHNWKDSISDLAEYELLFEQYNGEKRIGEVCTSYFHFADKTCDKIIDVLGEDVKIIIVLRNPVERLYSHYSHNVRDGDELLELKHALIEEPRRKLQNLWFGFRYKELGLYHDNVKKFMESFPNVKILLYDDFIKDEQKFLLAITRFLEVEDFKFDTAIKSNIGGKLNVSLIDGIWSSNKLYYKVIRRILIAAFGPSRFQLCLDRIRTKYSVRTELNPDMIRNLNKYYEDDIERLGSLINIDLKRKWLKNDTNI